MTTATRPAPPSLLPHAPQAARRLGVSGVTLGVAAGLTQLLVGSTIPTWSGNKLDTTGLGITTIVLGLVVGVGLRHLHRPLPRWERVAALLLVLACAGVCFTTVGRLWYLPGPLLIAAALLAFAAEPGKDLEPQAAALSAPTSPGGPAPAPVGAGGWLLYALAAAMGLAVAVSTLITVLLRTYASGVAAAAAVALVAGLALSAVIAPTSKRRAPAMVAGGFGAGLMGGGIVLGASAVMIAMS